MVKANKVNKSKGKAHVGAVGGIRKRGGRSGSGQVKDRVTVVPLARNVTSYGSRPTMRGGAGGTVVTHREFLGSVQWGAVPSDYSLFGVGPIQPGLAKEDGGWFEWLASTASKFDWYEFTSLKVHYTSTTSMTQEGVVLMAYDPNPTGPAPTTFSQLRSTAKSISSPARQSFTFDITDVVRGRKLRTRTAPKLSGYELYDVGKLFLGTMSGAGNVSPGYLDLEYSVRLVAPQMVIPNEPDATQVWTPMTAQRFMAISWPGATLNLIGSSARFSAPTSPFSGAATWGPTMATYVQTVVTPNATFNVNGCDFIRNNDIQDWFRFSRLGDYEISYSANIGMEDQVGYYFCGLMSKDGGNTITGATVKSRTDNGVETDVGCNGLITRGFIAGAATELEVATFYTFRVSVTVANQLVCIGGAWRNVPSAAATTGCSVTLNSGAQAGGPPPMVNITYLGPSVSGV